MNPLASAISEFKRAIRLKPYGALLLDTEAWHRLEREMWMAIRDLRRERVEVQGMLPKRGIERIK